MNPYYPTSYPPGYAPAPYQGQYPAPYPVIYAAQPYGYYPPPPPPPSPAAGPYFYTPISGGTQEGLTGAAGVPTAP